MNKPGVRTFEAVAYLRRSGADILRIRKMFRSDINEYKVRAEAIQNMEILWAVLPSLPAMQQTANHQPS